MANLLSLPDELLLTIVNHPASLLQRVNDDDIKTALWPYLTRSVSVRSFKRCNMIYTLMCVCKRFEGLLKNDLYWSPALQRTIGKEENNRPKALLAALNINPSLGRYIVAVSTHCTLLADIVELFGLPRIKTLVLDGLQNINTTGSCKTSWRSTSSVENLRLLDCNINNFVLETILSFPRSLKSLHYEIDFIEDAEDFYFELDLNHTSSLISSHEDSLESLVLTLCPRRTSLEESRLDPWFFTPLNLRFMKSLKMLVINHLFLSRFGPIQIPDENFYRRFPPSIEELRVIYVRERSGDCMTMEQCWLMPLMQKKRAKFPNLRKVTVYITDGIGSLHSDNENLGHDAFELQMSRELLLLAKEVEVLLEIEIGRAGVTRHAMSQ